MATALRVSAYAGLVCAPSMISRRYLLHCFVRHPLAATPSWKRHAITFREQSIAILTPAQLPLCPIILSPACCSRSSSSVTLAILVSTIRCRLAEHSDFLNTLCDYRHAPRSVRVWRESRHASLRHRPSRGRAEIPTAEQTMSRSR